VLSLLVRVGGDRGGVAHQVGAALVGLGGRLYVRREVRRERAGWLGVGCVRLCARLGVGLAALVVHAALGGVGWGGVGSGGGGALVSLSSPTAQMISLRPVIIHLRVL